LPPCVSVLDGNVLPLDVTVLVQPLPEGVDFWRRSGRAVKQETDPRNFRRLLPARRQRPSGCRAAEQRNEGAALHSIT
jgi:hypothetical protein